MIAQRALAVLCAAFLVGAIAIGSLTDPGWPLGHMMFAISPRVLDFFQTGVRANVPAWMWDWVVLPCLIRPAWLLPACVGVVCGGLYVTLASRQGEPRSRRKRS